MQVFLSILDSVNKCRDEPDLFDLMAWRMTAWRKALAPQEFGIVTRHIEERFRMFRGELEEEAPAAAVRWGDQ